MIALQGLEMGEKLLWLFEETHDVTKPTRSQLLSSLWHSLIIEPITSPTRQADVLRVTRINIDPTPPLPTVHSVWEMQWVLLTKDKFPGFPVSLSLPQDSEIQIRKQEISDQ